MLDRGLHQRGVTSPMFGSVRHVVARYLKHQADFPPVVLHINSGRLESPSTCEIPGEGRRPAPASGRGQSGNRPDTREKNALPQLQDTNGDGVADTGDDAGPRGIIACDEKSQAYN